ncbi:hypothetical protein PC39_00020 [Salinisphaera sp. PC39]|uniref:helix-turn-helix transcriptional regulator n=1 Tax=Salinisphaera sp. PC39 TaxID=1304156 RepID=UPI003341BB89
MRSRIAQGETLPVPVSRDLAELGAALRAGRARRRETQKALAARLNISATTVRAAERGDPGVGAGIYAALAWALGLPGLSTGMPPADDPPMRVRSPKKPIDDF